LYFGYSEIWRFTFIPLGFTIVMATFVALCLVYAVGASRGADAAIRYVNITTIVFIAAVTLDLLMALLSGQLPLFLRTLGWSPLIEMSVLAALCIGSMWFMAVSYATSRGAEGQ